jgi:predicted permease
LLDNTSGNEAAMNLYERVRNLIPDLRYAFRQLRKAPGFSFTVIATLALGIGANAAVFNLLRAVVFPSLPVPSPQQVFVLHGIRTPNDNAWLYSQPAFERLQQATAAPGNRVPIAAHSYVTECNLADRNGGESSRAKAQLVSTNFFSTLEVPAAIGRVLSASDSQPSPAGWPVVLRYGYWREHFAADPSVLGRSLVADGQQVFIAGVAPRDFYGVIPGDSPDFWLPLEAQHDLRYVGPFDSLGPRAGVSLDQPYRNQAALFWLSLVARVPAGQSSTALARWDAAFASDRELYAKFDDRQKPDRDSRFTLLPAARSESALSGQYVEPLFVLMGMVGLLLLIAGLNLANLQRTRVVQRRHDFAIRAALGASALRLMRQLAIESTMLAACGGALSMVVANIVGTALLRWSRQDDVSLTPHFDATIYLFLFGLLALAVFLFQLVPARRLIREGQLTHARGVVGSERGLSANLALAAQITFCVVLLSLTSMFVRTLTSLNHADAGLDRGHILTVRFDFRSANYQQDQLRSLYPAMIERITGLPGVRAVALDMCPPPNCLWNTPIHAAGISDDARGLSEAHQDNVGAGYFQAMGMHLLRGREFDSSDRPQTLQVAVVSHSFATKLFGPNENPIGHRFGLDDDAHYLIVGEIADAHLDDLRAPAKPSIYLALSQQSPARGSLQIRTVGNPDAMVASVQSALHAVDAQLPVTEILPLDAAYGRTLATEQLLARLTSVFSLLALVLAAIGIFGVLSFRVARRTGEFGVRMAFGATRQGILWLVMKQAGSIALFGIASGTVLAIIAAHSLRGLFFGVTDAGIASSLMAALLLILATLAAAFIPAQRAARTEPMQALRSE